LVEVHGNVWRHFWERVSDEIPDESDQSWVRPDVRPPHRSKTDSTHDLAKGGFSLIIICMVFAVGYYILKQCKRSGQNDNDSELGNFPARAGGERVEF
jgi:hypothetical protein